MTATTRDTVEDDAPGLRQMIDEPTVLKRVPMARMTLHRLIKKGRFPKPTYVAPGKKLFFLDEVVQWQSTVDAFDPRGRGRHHRPQRDAEVNANT